MLKNYFLAAYRNLGRNKIFSTINVLSLAIGISASLLLYMVVKYEFSYENFQQDGDRVYRVVTRLTVSGKTYYNSGTPAPMSEAITKEITGVENVIPFRLWENGARISVQSAGNRPTVFRKQQKVAFADENYFDLQKYEWLAGSAATGTQNPYNVVLTDSIARQYFPALNADEVIGKEIFFSDTIRTTVTGVVKDLSENTDFTFTTFLSKITLASPVLRPYDWNDWYSISPSSQLFVRLEKSTGSAAIESQLKNLANKYLTAEQRKESQIEYLLQPLSDLHFNGDYGNFGQRVAHKPTLYGLLAIAVFLLILGCINFINLTTARGSLRSKEIGVRKTMGSSKKQLLTQFLTETFFITIIAAFISITLLPLLLAAFADFIPEGLHFNMIFRPDVIFFLLSIIGIITILAGAYPAFYLSSFKPVLVLKGKNNPAGGGPVLRKGLTVSQFVIAQVIIVATILVSKQVNYSLHNDLGFKKDAIVYFHIPFSDSNPGNKKLLVNQVNSFPEVSMISLSNNPPSAERNRSSMMKYRGEKGEIESNIDIKYADTNYLPLYQMKLLAGNNLPQNDTLQSWIINKTYAQMLGFQIPGEAIGKLLELNNRKYPVTGVVSDFHQKSFHEQIRPLAIGSSDEQQSFINISLEKGTDLKNAISKIQSAWKRIYPEEDFEYAFLDETIAAYYKRETDIARLLNRATGLSILISYLGLTGLVLYITIQRKKEIGIRKIVGATTSQIIVLLLQEFIRLIIIASVIAIPIAWWSTHEWLQNFAYRTDLSWWIFLASTLIILIMTVCTLGVQAYRAAIANIVKSIRND